jgi:hypothetical protein
LGDILSITVLHSPQGKYQKRFAQVDSTTIGESPEIGYWFTIESKPVTNIHDLSDLALEKRIPY